MPVLYDGNIIGSQSWSTGATPISATSNTITFTGLVINKDNSTGPFNSTNTNVCEYVKQSSSSHLLISFWMPVYISPGNSGNGFRIGISTDNTNWTYDALDNGPADAWGAHGYGGATSGVWAYTWDTKIIDTFRSTSFGSATGTIYFYFQYRNWVSTETTYPLTYNTLYPKYGTIELLEYLET